MDESNPHKEGNSSLTLTHEEILELIEEIKELEKKYPGNNTEEPELKEFIEIEQEIPSEQVEFISVEEEPEKPGLIQGFKKSQILKNKPKLKSEVPKKDITPATFKIRVNDEGKLVNIDLKKSKVKSEAKKPINLKKFNIFKKKTKNKEKKSMVSRMKGGLRSVGKLKRVIPFRRELSEETDESETEEEE